MHRCVFKLAAALELGLAILGQIPVTNEVLPIGGSQIAQAGIIFGAGFVFVEIYEILREVTEKQSAN